MSTGSRQSFDLSSMNNKSIPELITFLKHALRESHFKEVEYILVEREGRAKLEIANLRTENEALKKKCEVLSLECGGGSCNENGGGERDRSAEEIYDQLVRELALAGGKKEKGGDEVGKLKRENEELKRRNAKLRKLVLDCVENYVDWNNRLLGLQYDVSKIKTAKVVGLDCVSKSRSGGNGESKGSSMQNDDNGLSRGDVRRVLDFDENDPVGTAPAKVKTEIVGDQGPRVAPVNSGGGVNCTGDDLRRASCEGTMASQKPIHGEHSNQNHANKGQKRKGYSYTSVVDLEKDSSSTDRFDIQNNGGNVKKDENSTQNIKSLPKVSSCATSTPGVSESKRVAAKSQHTVVTMRQCDERNAKQRLLLERLKMSVPGIAPGIAQTYDTEDSRDGDLSANPPKIRRQWKFLANMCADLSIDKICMSAVCALYRQHEHGREHIKGSTQLGFNSYCFERGTQIAEFLIDGDSKGRLRKTGKELQSQFKKGLEDCRYIAREHATQLFEIYQKKLDLFYPNA